jgi:Ni,Fe-hydrogenase I cytochrome b subunit
LTALRGYTTSFLSGEPQQYVGHNPLARLGISLLFLLLVIQLAAGLVIAGTDPFWPPLVTSLRSGVLLQELIRRRFSRVPLT